MTITADDTLAARDAPPGAEPSGSWEALLSGASRARALAALADITSCLASHAGAARLRDPDGVFARGRMPYVGGGLAGIALFWAELARMRARNQLELAVDDADEQADQHLERAMAYVSQARMLPSFLGGAFGIAWVVERVHRIRSVSSAAYLAEDANAQSDEVLDLVLAAERFSPASMAGLRRERDAMPALWEFDLFNGLAGVAVYALERTPRPGALERVRGIVARLAAESRASARGITWYRPVALIPDDSTHLFPGGHYSLGLGHGTAGVVAMLAQAYARGVCDSDSHRLLVRAAEWLWSWREGEHFPVFPAFLDHRERPLALTGFTPYGGFTPLCWTNTDLGVAVALAGAGAVLGRDDWLKHAVDVAVGAGRAALADPGGTTRVGFMTGMAGVAHISNRLWQATGDTRARELAETALERVLDARRPGHGLAGYFCRELERARQTPRDHVRLFGITHGLAGIGLMLLAANTSGGAPGWDNILLLSWPAASRAPAGIGGAGHDDPRSHGITR